MVEGKEHVDLFRYRLKMIYKTLVSKFEDPTFQGTMLSEFSPAQLTNRLNYKLSGKHVDVSRQLTVEDGATFSLSMN